MKTPFFTGEKKPAIHFRQEIASLLSLELSLNYHKKAFIKLVGILNKRKVSVGIIAGFRISQLSKS